MTIGPHQQLWEEARQLNWCFLRQLRGPEEAYATAGVRLVRKHFSAYLHWQHPYPRRRGH